MQLGAETIDKIIEISKPEYKKFGDVDYSTKPIHHIKPPTPNTLIVHTLTGIADYANKKIDSVKDAFFYIESPEAVSFRSQLDKNRQREGYLKAEMDLPGFNFDTYFNLEDFIINIQAQFVDEEGTHPKADLLSFLSTIKSSVIEKYIDDGVSQAIHLKSGISGGDSVSIPVPKGSLKLKPYRTFREVDQPVSDFVFRIKKSREGQPQVALHEADGQKWKLEAIQNIKVWLEENAKDIPVIA